MTVVDGENVVGPVVLKPKARAEQPKRRMLGMHKGNILYMADDFDAPLPAEYWFGSDP